MKKIYDISTVEVKQAFDKWVGKHHVDDELDMNIFQLMQYEELFRRASQDESLTIIADIFNHGFMCGYKQSKANRKAKKAEPEPEESAEEREAKECRYNIVKLIQDIASVEWLEKIYFFARAFTEDTEGKA